MQKESYPMEDWAVERSYQTPDYSLFFHYFFELYRIGFTQGKASDAFIQQQRRFPVLELDANGAVRRYILSGTPLLQDALLPQVFAMLQENLILEFGDGATIEQRKMMNVARTLMQAMVTDDLSVLQFMWPLWNPELQDFAQTDLYSHLPPDIREKYCV